MNLFVRVLGILLAVAFVVLLYYVTVWVLGLLGIVMPDKIITIIFVIIGLMAAIAALSGRFDNFWKTP
jgi:bacteriorhodopsin